MKTKFALGVTAVLAMSGATLHSARADTSPINQRVEISLDDLFSPASGWDDNDHIQVIAYGFLPNACYTLTDAAIQSTGDGQFLVRQFANKVLNGVCADESQMPMHMQVRIPFTKVIEVGALPAGAYQFHYSKLGATDNVRAFSVAKALAPTIDDVPYANVTQQAAPDVLNGASSLMVKISGLLNSTCVSIDKVDVQKQNDVFVVLPTLKIKTGVMCTELLVPFETDLDLGRQAPGDYLVHVRSQNGNAVNHVVRVMR